MLKFLKLDKTRPTASIVIAVIAGLILTMGLAAPAQAAPPHEHFGRLYTPQLTHLGNFRANQPQAHNSALYGGNVIWSGARNGYGVSFEDSVVNNVRVRARFLCTVSDGSYRGVTRTLDATNYGPILTREGTYKLFPSRVVELRDFYGCRSTTYRIVYDLSYGTDYGIRDVRTQTNHFTLGT